MKGIELDREVETSRRRSGWGQIGGAAMAVIFVVFATLWATGLALDEDPTNNISKNVWSVVALAGLIAAAVMLLRGIILLRSVRRERKTHEAAPSDR